MARVFTTSQYLETTSVPLTGPPFTIAFWFYVTDVTALHLTFGLSAATGIGYYYLGPRGDVVGDPIQVIADNGATPGTASTSTGYTANTWHHCVGVFASSTSRSVYLNGGGKGTDTTNSTPSGVNRLNFGRMYYSGSLFGNMSGRIAMAGLWSVALGDDEAAALAARYHPRLVRPASLVSCWDLGGFAGEYDNDWVGGYHLTPSGSPTWTDGPPIHYPTGALSVHSASGGGSSSKPWLFARQRRIIGGGIL